MQRLTSSALLILVGLAAAGCGSSTSGPLVFAAASTKDALEEGARRFAEAGGAAPRLHFASSAALARQIEAGAGAELFLSAHPRWTERLVESGVVAEGDVEQLCTGQLVWIAPANVTYELRLEPGFDPGAGFDGRLAMGDPDSVPVGRYGRQALESLGWWDGLAGRVVPAADARATLALVALGEVAAGIVYATDARASKRVQVLAVFPRDTHEEIRYTLAELAGAGEEARAFAAWLRGPEGAAVLERHGFLAVRR